MRLYPNVNGNFKASTDLMSTTPYAGTSYDVTTSQYKLRPQGKDYHFLTGMSIVYTESFPTAKQMAGLKNPQYTLVYSPHEDTVVIFHLEERQRYFKEYDQYQHIWVDAKDKPLTRAYILQKFVYSKPLRVSLHYRCFSVDNRTSIENISKQLYNRGTDVILHDILLDYTFVYDTQNDSALSEYRYHLRQRDKDTTHAPEVKPLDHSILEYVNTWASAYELDTPVCREDCSFAELADYNIAMLTLYASLTAYEAYTIDIVDGYTICPDCGRPYVDFTDGLPTPTCPNCDCPNDTVDDYFIDYESDWTFERKPKPFVYEPPLPVIPETRKAFIGSGPAKDYGTLKHYRKLWNAIATTDMDW